MPAGKKIFRCKSDQSCSSGADIKGPFRDLPSPWQCSGRDLFCFFLSGLSLWLLLQGEGHRVPVEPLQGLYEGGKGGPSVFFVGQQHAGEAFRTVEGDPGELAAVVV